MFSERIGNLTLTSTYADALFPNIRGDTVSFDTTFLATLRALLGKRMGEEDGVYVSTVKCEELKIMPVNPEILRNAVYLFNVTDREKSAEFFDVLDKDFAATYGYTELAALKVFIETQSGGTVNARFYINEEKRSAVVYVSDLGMQEFHLVQSFIPKLLPWFFKDKPLTDKEKDLCRSLSIKQSKRYKELIEDIANTYDMRSARIKFVLKDFETRVTRHELDNAQSAINDLQMRLRRNISDYDHIMQDLHEANIRYDGLKYREENTEVTSELESYFVSNKTLDLLESNDNELQFIVNTTLDNYDPDTYERIIANENSFMYTVFPDMAEVFRDRANRKKLLDALFSAMPTLKIAMCAYYRISLNLSRATSSSGFNYPECGDKYKESMPNPHLQNHNCLGDFRQAIDAKLRDGDYVGAVELCCISAASVNLGESASCEPMLRWLFKSSCKNIIRLPDGSKAKPTEALEYLIKKEKEANEQTDQAD